MKIHNNLPVNGTSGSKKAARKSSDGVFRSLLDAGMQEIAPVQAHEEKPQQPADNSAAWKTLEDSITLLDRALQCIESGQEPSPELVLDIEQLRNQVRMHLASNSQSSELRQADTLLAVEAERIRSIQR